MNIRKALAGSLAAIAAGATLAFGAFAAIGDYVDGSTVPVFAVGDNAAVTDVVSLGDITAAFAGYATTTTSVGGGATTTATGGQDLSTPNSKLYLASAINAARTTLTKTSEGLGTVLASGSFYDDAGNEYKYDQYISVGSSAITLGNSGGDLDEPTIYINVGTAAASPVYTTSVVFSKALNITSADVQSNGITLFDNDYTIGSGSTATKLILYGGANKHTIQEGSTQTITVGEVDHTVDVIGVSSSTQAVIEVDGVSKEVTEGTSYTINGDKGKIDVYVDAVWYFGKEAQVSSVRLSLGSSKLTLETGQEVKMGTEDTAVDNTLVTITGNPLSKLTVAVAAQDSDLDHIADGSPYTDPVFGGFQVAFGGFTPAIDDAGKDMIHFSTSGDTDAQVQFTDYRGNDKTFIFAHDNDTSTSTVTPILSDGSANVIHVVEGEAIKEKEYFVVSQGDFSHLYELKDISNVGSTNAKVEFKDVVDGSTVTVNLESPDYTNATAYIDGQTYYVNATSTQVAVTWGAGASAAAVGTQTSVFPMLGGKNGEALALLNKNQTVTNASVVYLPGGSAGVTQHTLVTGTTTYTDDYSLITWLVSWSGTTGTIYGVQLGSSTMLLNSPAVLVLEEKGKDTSLSDKRNAIGMLSATEGTSPMKMSTETVYFSDASMASSSSTANTYVTKYVDRYGVYGSVNTDGQGTVTLYYPDEQAYANVAIGPNPSFTTTGGTSEVETAVKLTSPVSKLASEVEAMIDAGTLNKDLVLVGGPCANSLVATLADAGAVKNCQDFIAACQDGTYTTGVIKEVADAFVTGKKALIVAGCYAEDTRSLASKVMTGTLSYTG